MDRGRFVQVVLHSPVTVIVISVVAPKRGKEAKANSIGEEDLRTSVHPHLKKRAKHCAFVSA